MREKSFRQEEEHYLCCFYPIIKESLMDEICATLVFLKCENDDDVEKYF